jgi:hypothetical protein
MGETNKIYKSKMKIEWTLKKRIFYYSSIKSDRLADGWRVVRVLKVYP